MNKTKSSVLTAVGLMSLVALMGCYKTSDQKIADAKADVLAANRNANEAKSDMKDAVADARDAGQKKVADAKEDVLEANRTAIQAKNDMKEVVSDAKDAAVKFDAREEWLEFKRGITAKIAANDRIIVQYKARMTATDGKLNAAYDKKIDSLEKSNKALKEKLDNFKDDGKNAWEKFKTELNHDVDELGKALKDFTVDNKK